ncbi:glucose 1-dehydrogenase [Eubacterium multiforme]|uniref:NAD(P)-dependent dehydrogenase (Short-subunit alcohol dehydrogenase family) n=1 Tax=Eubacterium multiforme TaxID=83339 RepID=A0ABT9UR23_9FIRM|nr:glucose 1-dehydrogenase [Eubacterium multiforme]MDQ0149081.1 NAD(P)-dependent dehydrogenase (short-subunit alcohol dehydrogenase family) [Eubacterium multiforme]
MIQNSFPKNFNAQEELNQPGKEKDMEIAPIYYNENYINNGKRLKDKVAIITGGDSGIGRAISLSFAREGAKVVIVYLNEEEDATKTLELVKQSNSEGIIIAGDVGEESFCREVISKTINKFKKIDIIVNNAGEQYTANSLVDITSDQLLHTFKTNVFSAFYMVKSALPHLKEGSSIINTTSITAYNGHDRLIDYSSSKGALTSFNRSLALNLANVGIRVNAVAPGPIWTPLIPASFNKEEYKKFGSKTAFKRPGQPVELAEAYVFLASEGASFITGETIHVNGGEMVNV